MATHSCTTMLPWVPRDIVTPACFVVKSAPRDRATSLVKEVSLVSTGVGTRPSLRLIGLANPNPVRPDSSTGTVRAHDTSAMMVLTTRPKCQRTAVQFHMPQAHALVSKVIAQAWNATLLGQFVVAGRHHDLWTPACGIKLHENRAPQRERNTVATTSYP